MATLRLTGRRACSSSGKPRSLDTWKTTSWPRPKFEELLRSPRCHPGSCPETHESGFLVVPSYYDDSTNATEYYDIDDHDDVDNDGYYDEYDEPEDLDNEWIDMSGIPEDATFEEPELACMLESLQKGKNGSGKGFQRGKKGWSKGESRDVLKAGTGVVLRTTSRFD